MVNMSNGDSGNRKLQRRGTMKVTVNPIVETVASVLGQMISSTAVYPIDIIKVVLQTGASDKTGQSPTEFMPACRMVLAQSGPLGFYRGIFAEYIKESTKMGVFFIVKSYSILACTDKVTGKIGWLAETLCGTIAGVLTQAVLIPLSVAHVRMQNGVSRQGFIGTIIAIGREGGPSELWKGLAPSVILAVYPALNFLVCNRLKEQWQRLRFRRMSAKDQEDVGGQWSDISLNSGEQFVIGALAQAIATFIVYPIILSRIVLQGGLSGQASMIGVISNLLVTGGPLGLFRGITPMLIVHALSGAFQWLGKEKVQETLVTSLPKSLGGSK